VPNDSAKDVYKSNVIHCFSVDDVLVYVGFYRTTPPDGEWNSYLEVAQRLAPSINGLLVVTQGSALTPSQRSRVRKVFSTSLLTAVLTSSSVTRHTLTALSWFGISICGFPPTAYRQALRWMKREHLTLSVERRMSELLTPSNLTASASSG
jgi:hypothetical protein